MALTVKQLNGDASFLLTLEPIETSDVALSTQPFHILLDPWVAASGSTSVPTSFQSTTHAQQQPCVASLRDLPDIDLVLVSSSRSDHCHEATLRQLPCRSGRTRILAAPAAARRIRSWRYFDSGMVEPLPRWQDGPGKERVLRVPILPQVFGGEPGEVTLTYIGQRRALHAAIGITYRPPTASAVSPATAVRHIASKAAPPAGDSLVPPCPPRLPTPTLSFSDGDSISMPGSPASSAGSTPPLLPATPPPPPPPKTPDDSYPRRKRSPSPHSRDRGVSVIFAPRGIPYRALQGYATTHLLGEAVLPLTALLHCFDAHAAPWYLGGLGGGGGGTPAGQETASALGAKAWISCGGGQLAKSRRYRAGEVQRALDRSYAQGMASPGNLLRPSAGHGPTEVLALDVGEEIAMTSEGVWEEETLFADDKTVDMLGLTLDMGEDLDGRFLTGEPQRPVDWLSVSW